MRASNAVQTQDRRQPWGERDRCRGQAERAAGMVAEALNSRAIEFLGADKNGLDFPSNGNAVQRPGTIIRGPRHGVKGRRAHGPTSRNADRQANFRARGRFDRGRAAHKRTAERAACGGDFFAAPSSPKKNPRTSRPVYRVLKPGGLFTATESSLGPSGDIIFPVPWAYDASINFLEPADVMRTRYHMAEFRILEWVNYSDKAIEHYERMLSAPPKLSGRLIFGDDAPERQRNSQRNLIEGRIIFWMITAERPKL